MKKRILTLTLALMLVFSLGANAAFSDMPEGEDGKVIERAVENGLLTGFEDNTFRPNDAITRAQMATIMTRALGTKNKADLSAFGDVKVGDWYYDALAQAVYMGAFKGDGANLNPNNNISRQEAMIVLSRIFAMPESASVLNRYEDASQISDWAKVNVNSVASEGYIPAEGKIRPLDPMTRLEFAQIIDKIASVYVTKDGEFDASGVTGNILVKANNVKIKNAKAKNLFVSDGTAGEVSFYDSQIERIITRGGTSKVYTGKYDEIIAQCKGTSVTFDMDKEGKIKFGAINREKPLFKSIEGVIVYPSQEIDQGQIKK